MSCSLFIRGGGVYRVDKEAPDGTLFATLVFRLLAFSSTSTQQGTPMNSGAISGTSSTRTASALNLIVSLWLIVSPLVLGYTTLPVAMWNSIIAGIIVLVLAWTRVANPERYVGLSCLNAWLGLWLIFSPLVLTYANFPAPTRNSVIFGVVVVILAIWSVAATPALAQRASK
jgi:SPW repeat